MREVVGAISLPAVVAVTTSLRWYQLIIKAKTEGGAARRQVLETSS